MSVVKSDFVFQGLLGHPLCMAMVRHKWISFGRYVYFLFLALFILFTVCLTEFLVSNVVPYSANHIFEECRTTNETLK